MTERKAKRHLQNNHVEMMQIQINNEANLESII